MAEVLKLRRKVASALKAGEKPLSVWQSADSLHGGLRETLLFDNPAYLYTVTRPHPHDGADYFRLILMAAEYNYHSCRMKKIHTVVFHIYQFITLSTTKTCKSLIFEHQLADYIKQIKKIYNLFSNFTGFLSLQGV